MTSPVIVPGEDGDQAALGSIDQVDRQGVVRHDLGQGVRHGLEHGVAFAMEQEALGDRDQLPLAGHPPFQRGRPPLKLLQLARIEERHRGLRADDLGQSQVRGVEGVATEAEQLDDTHDRVLMAHRHDDHRFVDRLSALDLAGPRIVRHVVDDLGHARHRDVTAQALAQLEADQIGKLVVVVGRLAGQLHRLERPPVRGKHVEAQAVPVDDRFDLARDGLGDVPDRTRAAELPRERLDALQLLAPTQRVGMRRAPGGPLRGPTPGSCPAVVPHCLAPTPSLIGGTGATCSDMLARGPGTRIETLGPWSQGP
jgi:hypothetical protein